MGKNSSAEFQLIEITLDVKWNQSKSPERRMGRLSPRLLLLVSLFSSLEAV
jgi:hypothetical protein